MNLEYKGSASGYMLRIIFFFFFLIIFAIVCNALSIFYVIKIAQCSSAELLRYMYLSCLFFVICGFEFLSSFVGCLNFV